MDLAGFDVLIVGGLAKVYGRDGELVAFGEPADIQRSYDRGEYDPWRKDGDEVHHH